MSMILYSTEAIEGHSFLEVSNYDLFVEHDSDGMPYLVLVRDNDDEDCTFTKLFELDMTEIYKQCTPANIKLRLEDQRNANQQILDQFNEDTKSE